MANATLKMKITLNRFDPRLMPYNWQHLDTPNISLPLANKSAEREILWGFYVDQKIAWKQKKCGTFSASEFSKFHNFLVAIDVFFP